MSTLSTAADNLQQSGFPSDAELVRGAAREIERLTAVLKSGLEIIEQAPELNMCNFDYEQVRDLNSASIEICLMLRAALAHDNQDATGVEGGPKL